MPRGNRYWRGPAAGVLVLAALAGGCATGGALAARMYDLGQGTVLPATFEGFDAGYGKVSAVAPDRERFAGEYTLAVREVPLQYRTFAEGQAGEAPNAAGGPAEGAVAANLPWPELYGYGSHDAAPPVGTATLVGDRGTVIEMVLFQVNRQLRIGDGVARDNRGRVYRVHLGDLEQ
jgi:hypothetical protein